MSGVLFAQRYIAQRQRENGYIPPDDEDPMTPKDWVLLAVLVLGVVIAIWGLAETVLWLTKK